MKHFMLIKPVFNADKVNLYLFQDMLQTKLCHYSTVPVQNTCWCHWVAYIQLEADSLWHREDQYDSMGHQPNPGSAKLLLSAYITELPLI